jgi:hypothetical protein
MPKMNCWEFHVCGREPGGGKVGEFGICPAALEASVDGFNKGDKGGRACWAVSGTLCLERVEEGFASKQCLCEQCDFYQRVRLEQGDNFLNTRKIRQRYLRRKKMLQLRKYPERNRSKIVNRSSTGLIMLWDNT